MTDTVHRTAPSSRPLVFLGGTFDPVHIGHLRAALDLRQLLGSDAEIHLLPCGDPRHRQAPVATAQQRLDMVRLAIQDEPGLVADDREVRRSGGTYTVDTLTQVRQEVGPDRPLIFVMGGDAFQSLPKWHRWVEIIGLAHIMVINRPNWSKTGQGELGKLLNDHTTEDLNQLCSRSAGLIAECALTQLDISSTRIRQLLMAGQSPRFLTPDSVLAYIRDAGLYAADA